MVYDINRIFTDFKYGNISFKNLFILIAGDSLNGPPDYATVRNN